MREISADIETATNFEASTLEASERPESFTPDDLRDLAVLTREALVFAHRYVADLSAAMGGRGVGECTDYRPTIELALSWRQAYVANQSAIFELWESRGWAEFWTREGGPAGGWVSIQNDAADAAREWLAGGDPEETVEACTARDLRLRERPRVQVPYGPPEGSNPNACGWNACVPGDHDRDVVEARRALAYVQHRLASDSTRAGKGLRAGEAFGLARLRAILRNIGEAPRTLLPVWLVRGWVRRVEESSAGSRGGAFWCEAGGAAIEWCKDHGVVVP